MKSFIVVAALALSEVTVSTATKRTSSQDNVTPIEKVLQMMGEMLSKGKKEKNIEEVEFAKFKTWCEDTIADTKKDIAEGTAKIEQLTADIAKAESDVKQLKEEIEEHEGEVAGWEADLKSATEIRETEKADYDATHLDYSESIDAIKRAIVALSKRDKDIPQSLLQVKASTLIPQGTKAAIESFLSLQSGNADGEAAPEANAYEFQSGGVITMLEKLLEKFEDELFALEKAEMNAAANYDLLKQKLMGNIADGEKAIDEKTTLKAKRKEDAATAKGDLEVVTAAKAEDEKTLADTLSECRMKSDEYEKNQVTRADEIKAITKAMEIISSPDVAGNSQAGARLVQTAPSLVQLRASDRGSLATRHRLTSFLQAQAKKLGSRYLLLVASRVEADPFKKVKKMIKDMIVKLMEEANAEADHKAFCDTELATNKQTRDIKSAKVDELTASVEEKTAESEKLATEIGELSGEIAEMQKQMADATALRDEEKAKNTAIIADAKTGAAAVEKAMNVLKEFYDKAGSLLQTNTADDMAQAMKAPYKGMGAESGGIIGMLEVILSDFARVDAETSSAEDLAQEEYDKFMDDAKTDVAVKQAEVDHKTAAKQRCAEALTELKKDLEVTQTELDAALDYYDKLKPDCVDMGLSYEDRVKRRKEEIQSLQEALKILSGESFA